MMFPILVLLTILAAQETSSTYTDGYNVSFLATPHPPRSSPSSLYNSTVLEGHESAATHTNSSKTLYDTLTNIATSTSRGELNKTSLRATDLPFLSNSSSTTPPTCPITTFAHKMPRLRQNIEWDYCAYMSAYSTDQFFFNYEDRCVAQSCSLSFWSAVRAYSGSYPLVHSTYPWMDIRMVNGTTEFGPLRTVTTSCESLILRGRSFKLTNVVTGNVYDAVQRTAPCCGACRIWASELELLFWPDQSSDATTNYNTTVHITERSSLSKERFVDEEGFTL